VTRAKVIDLPKEGLSALELEKIINDFIAEERPSEIECLDFNPEFGFLIIVYKKD
jgi:hypothetical protein